MSAVAEAGRDVVRRVSRRSPGWWRAGTTRGRTRAEAVAALVRDLAAYGARAEGTEPRTPPPAKRDDVLADQLAVMVYDLELALAARPDGTLAARAVAECLLTAYEVDPRPVPAHLLDAVLTGDAGPLGDAVRALPRLRDG